ncbi:disabled homolog 2-like isoform X1 [Xiphophorus maculatus]|uniref:disabled homolog 2-like isoform X1 n=1 Tax=Xiphophorus maculatus TaxID=8083 RepID=UPI000C6E7EAE|nr:disabled homolog 2-like isoform X1 [Xiphophorus maculatus]
MDSLQEKHLKASRLLQNLKETNIVIDTVQTAGGFLALGQEAVRSLPPYLTRGPVLDPMARYEGDGVRYKAKLIGVDPLPDPQGEKMLLDSMMKLKGFEVSARKRGQHKMRIWLKISSSGLKILDERTGIVLHDHDRSRISSVTKDKSDPRALAYIYRHEDAYILFYIKAGHQADPIILDIMEVCQRVEQQETSQQHQPTASQNISLVMLTDNPASPATPFLFQGAAVENMFSPPPASSSGQINQQTSPSNELLEIFSPPLTDPLTPNNIPPVSQPESPHPILSTAQLLSMFPTQPPGGSPYISPPVSPSSMPWNQQGLTGNQWPLFPAGPPAAVTAPPAAVLPPPGFMMTVNPAMPPLVDVYQNASHPAYPPGCAPAPDNNPLL